MLNFSWKFKIVDVGIFMIGICYKIYDLFDWLSNLFFYVFCWVWIEWGCWKLIEMLIIDLI